MPPTTDALHESLHHFGVARESCEAVFADLVRRYEEEGRHYHNLRHLAEVLAVVDSFAGEPTDLAAVRLAAWFHDAVYDSRAKDNEEQSAALAETVLNGFGLPPPLVAEVRRLILLTKTHATGAEDRAGHILLDADLAILGADEGRYDEYAAAIRREYAWVDEPAYRAGRGQVLEGFLRRPRLYFTDRLFASHEARARENLRRELAALRG
jgi:predicted metal-dependent HD superfamily phosphohydrolase